MKLLLFFIAIIVGFSALTTELKKRQPEKEAILRLNKSELQIMYSIIDESATPGNVRKPLLQKLELAYQITWPSTPPPAPIKPDSTKSKKP